MSIFDMLGPPSTIAGDHIACRRWAALRVVASVRREEGGAGALDLGAVGFRGGRRGHPSQTAGSFLFKERSGSRCAPSPPRCKAAVFNDDTEVACSTRDLGPAQEQTSLARR